MHTTHVLYKIGDRLTEWMLAEGVREGDANVFRGYWVGLVTKTATGRPENTDRCAGQLTAAIRVASAFVYRARGGG